jgi:hypothetical protein
MSTDTNRVRRPRINSENGMLIMVGTLVLLGAVAVMAIAGW